MRVLLVNTLYHPFRVGGAERSVQLLAEALAESGLEVTVASLSPDARTLGRHNGVEHITVPLGNAYWPFANGRTPAPARALWHVLDSYNPVMRSRFVRVLKELRPDVVHTNNLGGFSVAIWDAIRELGSPIVHTLRDHYLLCPTTTMFRRAARCSTQCASCAVLSLPKRRASQVVTAVVGISDFILRRHLAQGYFANSAFAEVIPNAVGLPSTANMPRAARPAGALRFGFLGRLHPSKGPDILLESSNRWKGNWHLRLAGRGDVSYESSLRTTYASNRIEFCGECDPLDFLDSIDVLICPSRCDEAFGRVVFEAAERGVPAIVSNRGGLPELISNGKSGILYEADSPAALAEAVNSVLADSGLLASLAAAASIDVPRQSAKQIASSYGRLYERALSA